MTMPALFIGHGSPMLAVTPNPFTPNWRQAALNMPVPRAVVCVSAHWETWDIACTGAAAPGLIYDFRGFPPPLYRLTYPAAGAPELAEEIVQRLRGFLQSHLPVRTDSERGFDHGAWAVMKHLYPDADIPLIQLSLCRRLTPRAHIAVAHQLQWLRDEGVLVLASGNLVHNLRLVDWQRVDEVGYGFDWARRAQDTLLDLAERNDLDALADYPSLGEDVAKAVNSAEHFLPLLYILALRRSNEPLRVFNRDFVGGALDMACVQVG